MSWFSSLLERRKKDPVMVDADFGEIRYCEEIGMWQEDRQSIEDLKNRAHYGFLSIPGDRNGPYANVRTFLLQKKDELPALWEMCTPVLEECCDRWAERGLRKPVREQFLLTGIGVTPREQFKEPDTYQVEFQSVYLDKRSEWLCVTITIHHHKVMKYQICSAKECLSSEDLS